MSKAPYDNLSHKKGALRRVYDARRTLSHVDAGTLEPEEFAVLSEIVDDLEKLEQLMEARVRQAERGRGELPEDSIIVEDGDG
jgi:DNA mismatch repair ATPase MutS